MSLFNLPLCLETDLFSLCCSWWMLATCCERFPAMKVPTTSLHRLFQHSFISGNFPVLTLTLPCCHLSPWFYKPRMLDAQDFLPLLQPLSHTGEALLSLHKW